MRPVTRHSCGHCCISAVPLACKLSPKEWRPRPSRRGSSRRGASRRRAICSALRKAPKLLSRDSVSACHSARASCRSGWGLENRCWIGALHPAHASPKLSCLRPADAKSSVLNHIVDAMSGLEEHGGSHIRPGWARCRTSGVGRCLNARFWRVMDQRDQPDRTQPAQPPCSKRSAIRHRRDLCVKPAPNAGATVRVVSAHERSPRIPIRAFAKADPSPDPLFYVSPRFIAHIDDRAIRAVTELYRTLLPPGGCSTSC